MPVYASTFGFADQRRHPRALILIVGGHAALLAAVMTAKMDMIPTFIPTSTDVELIPLPKPPPPDKPPPPRQKDRVQPRDSQVDQPKVVIPITDRTETTFDDVKLPSLPDQGSIGKGTETILPPVPEADPVRIAARFVTPERLIKPPYPVEKVRQEEEAVLRLKLSIDERGRVVSVEPVGRVERSFFEAARRHLIATWRYKPATEDGRPVASTTIISLTFRLE